ncbi:MAG: amidohydrolase family protein [Thermodesulfobacteriota bacterium]
MKKEDTGGLTRRKFIAKTSKTAALALTVTALGPLAGCGRGLETDYDLVIRGGLVYDGSASDPVKADVAFKDGKIAAVGEVQGRAAETVAADGLAVAPGFIDVHTHCDLTFQRSGRKRLLARFMPSWKGNHNYLYQGVTTVVTGNCGYGYTDTDQWLNTITSLEFGSNVFHLAPHGMIREAAFGREQPGKPDAKQMDVLKARVAEEMDKGAVGMSAGLEYAPGLLAPTEELVELCQVVRAKGGLFTVHMRDETGRPLRGRQGLLASIREVIEVSRRAEIPVEISHLKIASPHGGVTPAQVFELLDQARAEGLPITADQYPYDAGSTFASFLLPDEFKDPSGGVKDEFRTKDGRERIKKAIEEVFTYTGPEKTMITMYPGREELEGKTLKEIGEATGKTPSEAYVKAVCQDDPPIAVFFVMDLNAVKALSVRDYVLTASDGWTVPKDMTVPHPRTYGCFPRKLRRFVMEDKLVSLPQAVRSMTSLPAETFGLKDRGRIRPGYVADLAVLDLSRVADRATYQKPHQYSEGVIHLFVRGVPVLKNGRVTGDRAGRGLRRA